MSATARDLLRAARHGHVDAWLAEHLAPPEGHPLPDALARWQALLSPDAATGRVLAGATGVRSPVVQGDRAEVVLDTTPPLRMGLERADGRWRLATLTLALCRDCSAAEAFARDVLDHVQRTGRLGERLVPGWELRPDDEAARQARMRPEGWQLALSHYYAYDMRLSDQLVQATWVGPVAPSPGASAESLGTFGVRYADGRVDTWSIVDTRRGLAVDYAALAPDSPLRLDRSQVRAWRRVQHAREVDFATWHPTWRSSARGAATQIATQASGAVFDPGTDEVWVVRLDPDRIRSGVFRLDPATTSVTGRWQVPATSTRANLASGPWTHRWRVALSPDATQLAFTTPDRLYRLDVPTGELEQVGRFPPITALGFTREATPRLMWGTTRHDVWVDGAQVRRVKLADTPVAVDLGPDGVLTAWEEDGHRVRVRPQDGSSPETERRDGPCLPRRGVAIRGAVRRASDGAWLISCSPGVRHGHAWVPDPEGTVELRATPGLTRVVSVSPDGGSYVVSAPESLGGGVVLWDTLAERPRAVLGHGPILSADFDVEGRRLLLLHDDGRVVLWDLDALSPDHHVLPLPSPASAP